MIACETWRQSRRGVNGSRRTTGTMRTKSAKILIVYLPRLLAAVTQGSSFVENRRLIEASLSSRYFE